MSPEQIDAGADIPIHSPHVVRSENAGGHRDAGRIAIVAGHRSSTLILRRNEFRGAKRLSSRWNGRWN